MALAGSRYGLMKDTTSIDGEGVSSDTYPDVLTYFEKLDEFTQGIPLQYEATQIFIQRPYLITYAYYQIAAFEDLILTLNNIPYISKVEEGDILYIPDKIDVINFYNVYSTIGGTTS